MKTTNPAVSRMAKQIAAKFKGFDRKPLAEQMATYFAVGHDLRCVVADEATYGPQGVANIVSRVPQLGTKEVTFWVLGLAACHEGERDFMLEETATPLDNGQPLTLRPDRPAENEERFHRELAWVRRESPSEAVLKHIA